MRGARPQQTKKVAGDGSRAHSKHSERGAALITVVLMSMLLLAAGGALISVTSMSAVNAADATSESQAYYAAESGLQEVVAVMRGNVAPSTTLGLSSDPRNKISFRNILTLATSNAASDTATFPRLSRWMNYSGTLANGGSVVPLNSNYSSASGMAFGVEEIRDPDSSDSVVFSTSGTTSTPFGTCSASGCGGGSTGFVLTYTPAPATTVNTSTSGASNLGSFTISDARGTYTIPANTTFPLTINQTAPWPSSSTITCTLSGAVSKAGSTITSTVVIGFPPSPSSSILPPVYNLAGVPYTLPAQTLLVPGGGATPSVNVTLTPPEPQRLLVKVVGYGPRNAQKKMKMLVGKSAFSYNPKGAITLRSADDNTTAMSFNVGNSSQYQYDGLDNAGGASLPAFTVTSTPDYNLINGLPSNQVFGSPYAANKIPIPNLDTFLQTTDGVGGARVAVSTLRTAAQNQNRYFASGQTPSDFGASAPNGLFTFVDGDVDLPPGGGAGLLVVTGTLTLRGSSSFNGLILVLGGGTLLRDGGGNGNSLGAVAVAKFDPTSGNFLAPTFNSSGSGNSSIQYDSDWVRRALNNTGPGVLGVSEY
jgi:hypothetical protein